MTALKEARDQGTIALFRVRETEAPGHKSAFEATFQSMAGKSRAVPATSKLGRADG